MDRRVDIYMIIGMTFFCIVAILIIDEKEITTLNIFTLYFLIFSNIKLMRILDEIAKCTK